MHQPVLSTLAAGGGHPLIDLDGTVFIQFGVFLIMAFLATQWLFKPYLKMREERAEGIEGARQEAKAMAAKATAKMADYETKLAAARSKAAAEQRKIRGEAADTQREVTEKARGEASKAIEAAQTKVAKEVEEARAELLPKADALAQDIATKLLGREVA